MRRLIDADSLIAPLREEYEKVKQAFDETSVFKAPNDVALYGALMQEVGAVIGMIDAQPTVGAEPVLATAEEIEATRQLIMKGVNKEDGSH